MPAVPLTEDELVQKTTSDYLHDVLGWDAAYAYNQETYGPDGTFGRKDDRQVILPRFLKSALVALNPDLPDAAYTEALRVIEEYNASNSLLQINQEKYDIFLNGVPVRYRDAKGRMESKRLRVFDFHEPTQNHFLAVRELWVRGALYRRRADIVGFVNGIPLLFLEVKNVNKKIETAYRKNLADYKDTIPHLFHHNAMVILGNGITAKLGTAFSRFDYFQDWKRLEEDDLGAVDMETLLRGVCRKDNFLDLFENFILFNNGPGGLVKILARNHQFLGVNRAMQSVKERKERGGKLGVFWHTQGSGKSYSIVFFTRKIRRKLGGNFTFLICTDRDDLDNQIYKTFAGCGVLDSDAESCRASGGEHLKELLSKHKAFIFTLIQKFNQDVQPGQSYSDRDDIIVITDEAHRTQYGRLSLNMRNALPNASYIGFTGTPLFKDDEITRRIFGDYVSTYDFQRAVDDNATVPLFYDARGEKLHVAVNDINERMAEALEKLEIDNLDVAARLNQALQQDYHVLTAEKRLNAIAKDFVEHYSVSWETGKAMFVCIDKITCAAMHQLIQGYWDARIAELEKALQNAADEQDEAYKKRQIAWMRETRMAVIVSEEQGEVEKFRKWGLDITPHRALMKSGFETDDDKRIDVETAFKDGKHPFRVAIVCAMWLTGFDVPSLSTLYLDKPLKAHTLMQAIARANRVNEGKNNGLIIDYCGILKNLRKALATFAGQSGGGTSGPTPDPIKPADEDLIAELAEAIAMVRVFLQERGIRLEDIVEKTGFDRNGIVADAKEAINESDATRKRFEIMARIVFKKFTACLPIRPQVNDYRHARDAVNLIYKGLQEDRDKADISDIIRQLHAVVDDSIDVLPPHRDGNGKLFDISKIDFDRLRQEFESLPRKNTAVQTLRDAIENKLQQMIRQNPLRVNLQKRYEEIVAEYNKEKERSSLEKTFEELLRFIKDLDAEQDRAMREGLNEEALALYDLLKKDDLAAPEIKRIKKVSADLLAFLKDKFQRVNNWWTNTATRAGVRVDISNYLWDGDNGLPESYGPDEVEHRAEAVYAYVFEKYKEEASAD